MFTYEALDSALRKKLGKSFEKRLRWARLYWGPRNYDRSSIKEELSTDLLFDEWIKIETGRNRWLLSFHDEISDMSDREAIMRAILECKNWPVYYKLWEQKANRLIRHKWILLYALVDMTAQGGETENAFERKMREEGRNVERASSADDARGIDFWVDGKPVQVKSAGTKTGAKRRGKGKDWV